MMYRFWILLLVIAIGGFGCARTVTPLVTFGEQMTVTVNLNSNVDVVSNRYFLVLSSNANFKVALPYPDIDQTAPEFLEPGLTPQLGTAEAYYTKFYSTWSGFTLLDPGGYFFTKGPFVLNQINTREALATLGTISNKLTFTVRLDRVFGATVPDQIYFDFITVAWPNGQAKIPADHLTSTNAYVSKASGSIANIYDGVDVGLDGSLDIVNLKVEIQ